MNDKTDIRQPVKQCPFCGEIPDIRNISVNFGHESIDGYQIVCKCGIMTKNKIYVYDGTTERELYNKLILIWNTRV